MYRTKSTHQRGESRGKEWVFIVIRNQNSKVIYKDNMELCEPVINYNGISVEDVYIC